MKNTEIKQIKHNKRGQDEMVGFGLIIVLVSVILLVFVAATVNKNKNLTKEIDDYESNTFIQSTLQYTTACVMDSKNINVEDLIFECTNKVKCTNNLDSCYVLENTLKEALRESWKVGGENVTKGYELVILANSEKLIGVYNGNTASKNYRGNSQDLAKGSDKITYYFTAYY